MESTQATLGENSLDNQTVTLPQATVTASDHFTPSFTLNWRQTALSAVAATTSALIGALYLIVQNMVNIHTFSFTTGDLKLVLGAAILAFLGFLQNHLFTDQNGKYLGKY